MRNAKIQHRHGMSHELHNPEGPLDTNRAGKLLSSWETAKSSVFACVYDTEKEAAFLSSAVHTEFPFGLSVYVRLVIESSLFGEISMAVSEEMLRVWKITKDDLIETAVKNSVSARTVDFKNMFHVNNGAAEFEVYTLTTHYPWYGASAIFYPGILSKVGAEIGSSYFILPISERGVMIMPDYGEGAKEYAFETHKTSKLRDCLYDTVLYYDIRTHSLSKA